MCSQAFSPGQHRVRSGRPGRSNVSRLPVCHFVVYLGRVLGLVLATGGGRARALGVTATVNQAALRQRCRGKGVDNREREWRAAEKGSKEI